jgi:hypothetical protein
VVPDAVDCAKRHPGFKRRRRGLSSRHSVHDPSEGAPAEDSAGAHDEAEPGDRATSPQDRIVPGAIARRA